MFSRISKIFFLFILICILLLALALPKIPSLAQISPQEEKAALEKELKELEALEKKIAQDITKTQQEKNTLSNQISVLKNRIKQLDTQIQKSNLIIKDLGFQIQDTEGSIEKTSQKIEDTREKLSNILRLTYEEDQKSLVEVLLAEPKLSDFFDNLMALETLNAKNQELLKNIQELRSNLGVQKQNLDGEKGDLEKVTKLQLLQKQESLSTQKQQEVLLKQTQGKESEYQKMLKDTQKRAAEIRTRIFQLAGVADVDAPTFGEALEIAQWVQQRTEVRPAFLLSIITQESAIGRNVGQCYLVDSSSGTTYKINTNQQFPRGIHPTRDLPLFLQITKELGRDPLRTPVSCWINVCGTNCAWGGAMGPAQFIPSTWMLYKNQVASILGTPPNPWSVRDSFLAAGVLLRDNGAATNELRAAARYFGMANVGYESEVMQRATCIQTFIDKGTIDHYCERLVFIP